MTKKVWVQLFGHQRRKVLIDLEATDGAVVEKNLYWPNGQLVTEAELRNIQAFAAQSQDTANLQQYIDYLLKLLGENQLGGGGAATDYPLHRDHVVEDLAIPNEFQYLLWQECVVGEDAELRIEAGGELVILDEGLAALNGPDFTYVGEDLTQIDYDDGSQKILTYTNGNLTRVDLTRDGWTLRKDLYYDVNDDLDYIDENYV